MTVLPPASVARAGRVVVGSGRTPRSATPYLLIALAVLIAWQFAIRAEYRPGEGLGYAFGLTGGVSLLLLLTYSIAKRLGVLRQLLALRHWFRGHMLLGVLGPALILLHTRLSFGSVNGAVAFAAMAVVFASGVFGRFVYARIHQGLYGRRVNLNDLKVRLGLSGQDMHSRFHFHPPLERQLEEFEHRLLAPGAAGWRLVTVVLRVHRARRRAGRELRAALTAQAAARGWDRARSRHAYRVGMRAVSDYLGAIRDVALFSAYERLFSAWHLLHIPLMVILVVTGAIHVLAVHMY